MTTYDNGFESQKLTAEQWDEQARRHFISDATLARWLQELPGRQIALIISSCHAGSMIDARLLAKFGTREASRVKGISGLNVSVVASCMPDEYDPLRLRQARLAGLFLCGSHESPARPCHTAAGLRVL